VKMKFFFRKSRDSEILVREKFSVPQNSAPGLCHWRYPWIYV